MPTNREILYTIRMRNAASAAIRQLNADMKAQGTTLKEVARQVQAVTTELGKLEGVVTKTDKAMGGMWPRPPGSTGRLRPSRALPPLSRAWRPTPGP